MATMFTDLACLAPPTMVFHVRCHPGISLSHIPFPVCVSVHMCVCMCCVYVGRSANQRQGAAAATKTTGNLHHLVLQVNKKCRKFEV